MIIRVIHGKLLTLSPWEARCGGSDGPQTHTHTSAGETESKAQENTERAEEHQHVGLRLTGTLVPGTWYLAPSS